MTLKEYIENLNEFVKENPEALDYIVVYSSDDEGNSYSQVYYTPSIGQYKDYEFIHAENFEDREMDGEDANAVCIN
jgi:hypothetical protein